MTGRFHPIERLASYKAKKDGAVLFTRTERVSLGFLAAGILRVGMTRRARGMTGGPGSGAVILDGGHPLVDLCDEKEAIRLSTSSMTVMVGKFPLHIDVYSSEGRPLCLETPDGGMGWRGLGTACYKSMRGQEHFYGFGEKTGYLDKSGTRLIMWNTDVTPHLPSVDSLYISIPFFIGFNSAGAYGLFLDSPAQTCFDLGKTVPDRYMFATTEEHLDYYVLAGPTMKDVLGRYALLTGSIPLPPLWALGYHQSRYSYYPDSQLIEVAQSLREKSIPCDALYLDIHYMDGFRVFTFDEKGFGAPKALTEHLASMGFKVVSIVDPGVKVDEGYGTYNRGLSGCHFVSAPDGEPLVVKVWPGEVHMPDFTRETVRAWWADEHQVLFTAGIAGIWNDMNEPSVFDTPTNTLPLEAVHGEAGQEIRHELAHNIYANRMAEATWLAFEKHRPGERPFIVSRAGYAGIQRYACNWTGDNCSWWEHLLMAIPMCLNLGLSGQPFVGADIGGFIYDAHPELVTRWTQLGIFMPLFRNHSALGTCKQEPYALGEPYESICREFIRLRYRLIPLLYTLLRKAAATGEPVMRPMAMEFPEDHQTHQLHDQFMFGRDILVAPIYQPGAECRPVYLPNGKWFDFWSGAPFDGGGYLLADAPLERIPLFVREGGIVPHGRIMNFIGEKPQALEVLEIYASSTAESGGFDIYMDDGKSLAYRDGDFGFMRCGYSTRDHTDINVDVRWDWPGQVCALPLGTVRILGISTSPVAVSLNGRVLPEVPLSALPDETGWSYDPALMRIHINLNQLAEVYAIRVLGCALVG